VTPHTHTLFMISHPSGGGNYTLLSESKRPLSHKAHVVIMIGWLHDTTVFGELLTPATPQRELVRPNAAGNSQDWSGLGADKCVGIGPVPDSAGPDLRHHTHPHHRIGLGAPAHHLAGRSLPDALDYMPLMIHVGLIA
jgi:hypothetical protein